MKTLRDRFNTHRPLIGSIAAFVIVSQPVVNAALVFNLNTSTHTQNFDSMGVSNTVNALPTGWGFNSSLTFADATTDTTRGAGSTGTGVLNGTSSGGAYMLVNGVLASGTDKSIGYLTSGSFSDNRNILFGFVNNTGSIVTELSLSFDYEKYRSGTATRDWAFFASSSDTAWGTAIASGAQSYSADANNTVISNPPTSISKTVSITGLSLAAGANYYFRWNYDGSGTGGNGQALSIDNFSLAATLASPVVDLFWDTNGATLGIGGTGDWNTTSTNWNPLADGTGTPAAITSGSKVIFGGTAGTVTIGAGGVSANGSLQFDSAGYTIEGGALTIGNSTILTAHAVGTTTISSVIAGSVGVQKTGAGTLVLSGANTFSGAVAINAGVLKISADTNLGTAANAVQLGGGKLQTTASVSLNAGRSVTGSGSVAVDSGTTLTMPGAVNVAALSVEGTGTLALTGTTPTINTLTIADAATISSTNAIVTTGITSTNTTGMATVSASLDFGTTSRTISVADGSAAVDLLLSGNLNMTGAGSRLTKVGEGTLDITGTNTISGIRLGGAGSSPLPGGTLNFNNGPDLGTNQLQLNAGVLNNTGAAFTTSIGVSIGAGQTGTNGATISGGAIIFQGPSNLFKQTTYQHKLTANTDVTFGGGLNTSTGTSSGLTISGSGTVILPAAANTITENITVDGGNLEISGSLTGSTIPSITTINLGILSGNSTSEGLGDVTAGANGLVDPGTTTDDTGVLNIGNFNISSTGGLNIELGGIALGDFDRLKVNGTVNITGTLLATLVNSYIPGSSDTLIIVDNDAADPVVGAFIGLPEMASVGSTGLFISYVGGNGNDIVLTAVPEPGSAALLLGGLAMLGARRRRR